MLSFLKIFNDDYASTKQNSKKLCTSNPFYVKAIIMFFLYNSIQKLLKAMQNNILNEVLHVINIYFNPNL